MCRQSREQRHIKNVTRNLSITNISAYLGNVLPPFGMSWCQFCRLSPASPSPHPLVCIKHFLFHHYTKPFKALYKEWINTRKKSNISLELCFEWKQSLRVQDHHSIISIINIIQIIFHNMKANDVQECQNGISTVVVSRREGDGQKATTCIAQRKLKYTRISGPYIHSAYLHQHTSLHTISCHYRRYFCHQDHDSWGFSPLKECLWFGCIKNLKVYIRIKVKAARLIDCLLLPLLFKLNILLCAGTHMPMIRISSRVEYNVCARWWWWYILALLSKLPTLQRYVFRSCNRKERVLVPLMLSCWNGNWHAFVYCIYYVCVLYNKIHTAHQLESSETKELKRDKTEEAASSWSEREKNGHDFHF